MTGNFLPTLNTDAAVYTSAPLFLLSMLAIGVFLVLPGAFLARVARLSWLPALALGAPVTAGVTALAGQVFSWVHLPWEPLTAIVFWVLLLGSAGFVGWRRARKQPQSTPTSTGDSNNSPSSRHPSPHLDRAGWTWLGAMFLAFVFAAVVQLGPYLIQVKDFGLPSQLFDSMFHYSGIRLESDTGNAAWYGSLNRMFGMTSASFYYPNQFHTLVALWVSWLPVIVAANAFTFVLVIVVWPLAIALLASYVSSSRSYVVPLSIALSPAPLVFPYYLGVLQTLYPYMLAMIWWPVAMWVILKAGDAWAEGTWRQPGKFLLGGLVILATVQAHPSSLGFVAAFVLVSLLSLLLTRRVNQWWWLGALALAGVGLFLGPLALNKVGYTSRMNLADDATSLHRAVFAALNLSQLYSNPWWAALPLGLLMVLGLVWHAFRARDLRFLTWWMVIALLVVATKLNLGPLSALTSLWYGAFDRISAGGVALLPVMAALGAAALAKGVTRVLPRKSRRIGGAAGLAAALVTAACLAPFAWNDRMGLILISYVPGHQFHAPWVDQAELAGQRELDLGPDALVLGDPTNGSGLLYANAGIETVLLSPADTAMRSDDLFLANHFDKIHRLHKVCEIIRDKGVTHFYDAPTGAASNDFQFPGLHNVDTSTGFTEVARIEGATVYRIDACGEN